MRIAISAVTVLWLCVLASAVRALAAEDVDLPAELALDAAAVTLELGNAELAIVVDPAAEPVLRARRMTDDGSGGERLEARRENGALTLRRPTDGGKSRLRIDVVVGPGHQLEVRGADLALTIEDQEDSKDPAAGARHAVFRLALQGSQADLSGLRDADVTAAASSLWLDGTRGSLTLKLDAGSAQVRGHLGKLRLEAADARVALIDFRGNVAPDLHGGSLEVKDGDGFCAGKVDEGVVLFENWRGRVAITGSRTTLEARSPDRLQSEWKLDGSDLGVTLEQLDGTVDLGLRGGTFSGADLHGKLVVKGGRGAQVELTELDGNAELALAGGASARIAGVSGLLKADVRDGSLQADRVRNLALDGARSEIVVGQVERVSRLEVSDGKLSLDLAAIRQNPTLQLAGEARAEVWLPQPCVVHPEGPPALIDSSVEVSGCELRIPGQPLRPSRSRLIYGDRRPLVLTVKMSEDVTLEVTGQPR